MSRWRASWRVAGAAALWVSGAVAVSLAIGANLPARGPEQLMLRDPAPPPPRATPAPPKTRAVTYEPWEKVPS